MRISWIVTLLRMAARLSRTLATTPVEVTNTDLVHYVRSGDFILALIHDARDVCEYAFALGALAHYSADMEGHRMVRR